MNVNKKIFLCDDEEDVLTSLKKLLELSGFQVMATTNPHEAVDAIKAFQPDVILLDLLMPGMGGFEVCETLNRDEATKGIPIIVISVLSDYMDIKRAYKLGVTGYFTKPYDFKDVLKEINKTIDFKRAKPPDTKDP